MELKNIITLLNDIYLEGRNPHDSDPALGSRIEELVQQLSNKIAAVAGTRPAVRGPANMDSYYLVSWPLQQGLPSDPTNVDVFKLSTPARYLTARVCHFAPLVEFSWLELGCEDEHVYRQSAELLDANILATEPNAEAVALSALETSEELHLEQLSWDLLRSPAPSEWPRQYWMPEQPEIRNYLFPGFFETWPE